MEDDLKILKKENIGNHWLDLSQISKMTSNGRQPQMEEDLQ